MVKEKRLRIRYIVLLFASYVFYHGWDGRFCFLMLFFTLGVCFCSLQMDKPWRKTALVIGVVVPLILLRFFTLRFLISFFCDHFGIVRVGTNTMPIAVGVSFLHPPVHELYHLHIWWEIESERNFGDYTACDRFKIFRISSFVISCYNQMMKLQEKPAYYQMESSEEVMEIS